MDMCLPGTRCRKFEKQELMKLIIIGCITMGTGPQLDLHHSVSQNRSLLVAVHILSQG